MNEVFLSMMPAPWTCRRNDWTQNFAASAFLQTLCFVIKVTCGHWPSALCLFTSLNDNESCSDVFLFSNACGRLLSLECAARFACLFETENDRWSFCFDKESRRVRLRMILFRLNTMRIPGLVLTSPESPTGLVQQEVLDKLMVTPFTSFHCPH